MEREIFRFAQERDIADDEPYLPVTPRTVQSWITNDHGPMEEAPARPTYLLETRNSRTAENTSPVTTSADTGPPPSRLEKIPVIVMMAIGGWLSYSAIES